jgi:hypothetical protein
MPSFETILRRFSPNSPELRMFPPGETVGLGGNPYHPAMFGKTGEFAGFA